MNLVTPKAGAELEVLFDKLDLIFPHIFGKNLVIAG
jgi:hypothetical protein